MNSSKFVSVLSAMILSTQVESATRNMTSRLAIKFPTPYEWWSNALPPEQEKAWNAWGMPGGGGEDVEASIWLVHNIGIIQVLTKEEIMKKLSIPVNNLAGILFSFEFLQYKKQLAKSATFMMILFATIMIFHLL